MTAATEYDSLPPTEYLIMEVLAARARPGETHWTFPSRLRPFLWDLARRELITWRTGTAPKTLLASLTDHGRAEALSKTYEPPCKAGDEGRLARVEVKGFRDLGIVRVTESTLAGEPMLRAEDKDGAVAEFPASSLHFITWLPGGAEMPDKPRAAIGPPAGWSEDWDSAEDSVYDDDEEPF